MRTSAHALTASPFLTDLPSEVKALLDWFEAGADPARLEGEVRTYADAFESALRGDQAIVPNMDVDSAQILAMLLTQHVRNTEHSVGWLNLGFALRRIAISDPESLRASRLERAIACFDRSLTLSEGERPVSIRAWAGKALAFRQLGNIQEAVRCSKEALKLDRSDPNLWLLHSSFVEMAGAKGDALHLVEQAFNAYVMAGRPAALRHLFEDVGSHATVIPRQVQ